MDKSTHRAGRLSLRMTPTFLDKCKEKADQRGQTLTEFTQIAMARELVREPTKFDDLENEQHG